MPGRLELRTWPLGRRHYLNGRPVNVGADLELMLAPAVWLSGKYDWTFQQEDRPLLYLRLGGPVDGLGGMGPFLEVRLPEEALLRWPAT